MTIGISVPAVRKPGLALSVIAAAQPEGTGVPDALTRGHTAGIVIAGALYLAAFVVAAITLREKN